LFQRRCNIITQSQPDYPIIIPGEKLKILLVNHDFKLASVLKNTLDLNGRVEIFIVSTGNGALNLIQSHKFDAIVSDYDMEDMNGMDLSRALLKEGINNPFILYTFPEDLQIKLKNNPDLTSELNIKIKTDADELVQKIIQAVELYRTKNRLELYSKHLEELVEERTRQLEEAQRFAVIGELAAMIGHDMRNPLQVITNLTFILSKKISKMTGDEIDVITKYGFTDIFSKINNEISYLNKIVSDLQDYAKEVKIKQEPIRIKTLFEDLIAGIDMPEGVNTVCTDGSDLKVSGDFTLLRRIFMNLFLNAIQGMDKGGILTFSATREQEFIRILISDTGTGIPLEVQSRIFDPLFTTKSKGTGLGLSVVKRLTEAHSGSIRLVNSSSGGTTFEVRLPAFPEDQSE
jgi:signal transduction histidine kinase